MSNDDTPRPSLLERDLEHLVRPHTRDNHFRRELRNALEQQAQARATARRSPLPLLLQVVRAHRFAFAAAVLVVALVASVLGYSQLARQTQLAGPATASAATMLRAAAASAPASGEVAHDTYSFSVQVGVQAPGDQQKGGSNGTVDVWIAGGSHPARSVQTVTFAKFPGLPEELWGRFLQVGGATYGYDATNNALVLPSEPNGAPAIVLPNDAYDGATLAQSIEQLAARGSRVVALPPQTLEGTPVNVIQADGVLARPALRVTLYLDARTNLLRGFDAASDDPAYNAPSWQVRLQSSSTMPASSVPAGTFALQLPSEAIRVALRPEKLAIPPVCGEPKLGASTSPLAACQGHDPGLTSAQLVSMLAAPSVADLHQAVAEEVLSSAQASAAQANLEAQLVRIVQGGS